MGTEKYKIMRNKTELSDAEIMKHSNFDALLQQHYVQAKTTRNIKYSAYSAATLAIIAVVIFTLRPPAQEKIKEEKPVVGTTPKPQPATYSATKINPEKKTDKTPVVAKPDLPDKPSIKKNQQKPEFKDAEPIGGYEKLFKYFSDNLQYPVEAKASNVQGTVMVEFYVGKDGRPEQITIVKSVNTELDAEAIRLVKTMPDWAPASYGEKKVSTRKVLPFEFKIEK